MQESKIKVMTIVGTRPEIIRLSRTIALLDEHADHVLVHTGQNYDYELNEIFFKDLEIRKPDHFLEIDTTSLGAAVGDIMRKSEAVLRKEIPDAMLVLGDTNSCLAAYMAKRMHIPIFHMEAGNRSFDFNVPEEINRRIIDHIADFNLVYTEHARRHLISEGLPHRRIYLTGSPMKEVLDYYRPKIEASSILEAVGQLDSWTVGQKDSNKENSKISPTANWPTGQPEPGKYFLVSVHREENVDNPENLQKILTVLDRLVEKYELPVIVSTHPRTRKRLEALEQEPSTHRLIDTSTHRPTVQSSNRPTVQFLRPFGFTDYIHLQQRALCVISDSGTISEESAILGFPAISLRQSMERPEAQDAGTIILTGFDPEVVLQSVELVISEHRSRFQVPEFHEPIVPTSNLEHQHRPIAQPPNRPTAQSSNRQIPPEYQIPDTSWRVLKLIMGNAGLSNKWWGINN